MHYSTLLPKLPGLKTININKRRQNKSPREISLGNGQRIQFKSAREANRFIAETNRYLTKVLVTLNDTYIQVWTQYRQFWFIASNTNTGTRSNYLQREADVKKALDSADFMFNKFTTTCWGSNDPYFAFIDLKKIALFLKDAAEDLAAFHKGRDHTGNYYSCVVLVDRCIAILAKLESYCYEGSPAKG